MNLAHKPKKILITGKSGTGKTTFFCQYLLGTRAGLKFVFDHEGEFQARLKCQAATDPASLARIRPPWALFDPSAMFPGRLLEGFDYWARTVFAASTKLRGRKVFACDELQKLTTTSQISSALACVLETGRRYELDFVCIAQAPNLLHNRIRNQITEVVTFQQIDANALDYLGQVGFDPDQVRGLRPGAFLARNLDSGGASSGRVF